METEDQQEKKKLLDEVSILKNQIHKQNIAAQEERNRYDDMIKEIENLKKTYEIKIKELEINMKKCKDECICLKQIKEENSRGKQTENDIKNQGKKEENLERELERKRAKEEKAKNENDEIKIDEELEKIKDEEKKKQEEDFEKILEITKIENAEEAKKTIVNQATGIFYFQHIFNLWILMKKKVMLEI